MPKLRAFHWLHRAHSALFRAADRALRQHSELTSSQQAVLFVLMQEDGAPISAIARELDMSKSSLTGLIDRMAEKGLVRRRPSALDGRSFELYINEAGKAAAAATLASTRRINDALLAPFSAAEREVIARFLEHVANNAEHIVNQHIDTPLQQRKTQ